MRSCIGWCSLHKVMLLLLLEINLCPIEWIPKCTMTVGYNRAQMDETTGFHRSLSIGIVRAASRWLHERVASITASHAHLMQFAYCCRSFCRRAHNAPSQWLKVLLARATTTTLTMRTHKQQIHFGDLANYLCLMANERSRVLGGRWLTATLFACLMTRVVPLYQVCSFLGARNASADYKSLVQKG